MNFVYQKLYIYCFTRKINSVFIYDEKKRVKKAFFLQNVVKNTVGCFIDKI